MRIIEKTISLEEFRKIHTKSISEQVEKEVQLAFDTIPKNLLDRDKRKWMGYLGIGLIVLGAIVGLLGLIIGGVLWVFLIGLVFLVPGVVLFFMGKSVDKEINAHIQRTVNEHRLYASVFNHFDDIDFLESNNNSMQQLEILKTNFSIPKKAQMKKASSTFSMRYKSKYLVDFQNAMWFWTEKSDKKTQNFIQWMGLIEVTTPDDRLLSNFDFSLQKNNKWLGFGNKKNQLENANFHKNFDLQWNDDLKIRQIFTPLAMENVLKYTPKLPVKNWFLRKQRNLITLPFITDYADVMILNFNSKSRDVKTITHYITEDIIKDCYFMFSIFALLRQMPLL